MIRFLVLRRGRIIQRHEFGNGDQGDTEWRFMLDTQEAQFLEFGPFGRLLRASGVLPLDQTISIFSEVFDRERSKLDGQRRSTTRRSV